jgi:hypothetical protein
VVSSDGGSRVDGPVYGSGQLSGAEFAQCKALSGELRTVDGGVTDAAADEPDYVRCP